MKRQFFILFILILICNVVLSQQLSNLRQKNIALVSDSVQLDSLSLVPGTFQLLTPSGEKVDSSLYKIDGAKSLVIINTTGIQNKYGQTSLVANYKVMPMLLTKTIQHKYFLQFKNRTDRPYNPFESKAQKESNDFFKMDGLTKNGSISRGINFGNNQNLAVNSNLNLQVSGRLSENIDIVMAATDNNIPIQADGNTQQLQEFDKIFIQLSDQNSKLIAGDFQLIEKEGYFMKFNKKNQGLNFTSIVETNPEIKNGSEHGTMNITVSAAVSRGKFARNVIQGVEKSQGPYFLKGAEGEQFIIVLSGTERIYIDGVLLTRGQDNDYTIDYNTAQITFTAKRIITKDKRIEIEFQYSDKNYARSMLHFGDEFIKGNWKVRLSAYIEQDSKNKPLQQDLSDAQKLILVNAGDDLSSAVSPSIDSVAFSTGEVLYQKTDSITGSGTYSIYVYSTNPTKSHYRVAFSKVLMGRGNYKQAASSANGKVFQWVEPIGGVSQGDFEPVVQLISPKKKQMVTAGAEYKISTSSSINVEAAYTDNNINTFSKADKANDEGYGFKLGYNALVPLKHHADTVAKKSALMFITKVNYEYVQQNFSQIERFRAVEFDRDWSRTSSAINSDQHMASATIGLNKNSFGSVMYHFNSFNEGSFYDAMKNGLTAAIKKSGFVFNYTGNLMNSRSTFKADFLRQYGTVSQKIRWINIGVKAQQEQNLQREKISDTLLYGSIENHEYGAFINNSDTTKNKFMLSCKQRDDFIAQGNTMKQIASAQEASASVAFLANQANQLSTTVTYRNLEILNTSITALKPNQTLLGRIEHNFYLKNNVVSGNLFYEIGSGQEVKKEYSFIEVAAGQGTHSWTDYNGDGIQQLNEFEVAIYKDQAKYVKIYTPTNETITVYSNQFSEVFGIKPSAVWANKKGLKKFISLFANQTAYRTDRKTGSNNAFKAYDPFLIAANDTALKTFNSSFRNTIFFNQLSSVFGADYNYQDNRNRSILTNGIETRVNTYNELRLRWNATRQFSLNVSYKTGQKYYISQFFITRNYNITYFETEPKVNYQPNTSYRISLIYKYSEKNNSLDLGGQKTIINNYGAELRYNVLQKGSLNMKANYIRISYNDITNSSIAYEMLEGLKTGENITWNISWQQNLSGNLTMNLTYDGRKSENNKAIHTGGVQVRAFF